MTGRAILRLSPIALLVVIVAACGGGGGGTFTQVETVPPSTTTQKTNVRVYFLRDGKVQAVARTVQKTEFVAGDAYEALRNGVTPDEAALGLTSAVIPDIGGVDLSPTKLAVTTIGPPDRTALAQIVYTLTQFRGRSVLVDGKHYTRSDFEDETPIILVDSPLPFARVSSPLRVTGTANTFEATFNYDLVDASGKVISHHFETATSGTGTRGTFDFTIRFAVPKEQQGKLLVYELSAADGSRIHQSEIPLTLAP